MYSLKSDITVIGAGKISCSLVSALKKSGLNVTTIISRKKSSAKKLASKFKIRNYSSDLSSLQGSTGIFFIAVPDTELVKLAKDISIQKINFKDSLFAHLSGTENVSALQALELKKAKTASFHIMQSFPSTEIVNIRNCYAAIESNNKNAEKLLFSLAGKLGLNSFKLKSESKIYYHIAGVISSNFLAGNFFDVEKLFKAKINSSLIPAEVFLPIITSTLEKIKKSGSLKSLSGPVQRGDITTIKKHIKALNSDKILRKSYIAQSLNLIELIKKRDKKLSVKHRELESYLKKL